MTYARVTQSKKKSSPHPGQPLLRFWPSGGDFFLSGQAGVSAVKVQSKMSTNLLSLFDILIVINQS